jgi:hypothetical protein
MKSLMETESFALSDLTFLTVFFTRLRPSIKYLFFDINSLHLLTILTSLSSLVAL